jgi:hypothetical protein
MVYLKGDGYFNNLNYTISGHEVAGSFPPPGGGGRAEFPVRGTKELGSP